MHRQQLAKTRFNSKLTTVRGHSQDFKNTEGMSLPPTTKNYKMFKFFFTNFIASTQLVVCKIYLYLMLCYSLKCFSLSILIVVFFILAYI